MGCLHCTLDKLSHQKTQPALQLIQFSWTSFFLILQVYTCI